MTSGLRGKEVIEPGKSDQVAMALKVPAEAIKSFDEDMAVNIIASDNNGKDNSSAVNFQCTFNPLDKLPEQIEENKKLYEALLKSEREKIVLLKRMLGK